MAVSVPAWAEDEAPKAEMAAPASGGEVFKSPILVWQPGVTMSLPSGTAGFGANALFRFLTLIPMSVDWVLPLMGVQWTPFNAGAPAWFWGLAFPLPFVNSMTGGWLSLLLLPVHIYAGGNNIFDVEAAFLLNVGKAFTGMMSPLSGMAIYVLVDELIYQSGVGATPAGTILGMPVITAGLSIPIAPWK
jgi:hypothetical protein